MNEAVEKLINGIKNFVILGEAGCGKSEIALNLSLMLKDKMKVNLIDLDQIKPLFRSRDVHELMEKAGVSILYQDQFLDAPTVVGGVEHSLKDSTRYSVLDVGGNDTGACTIGQFASLLNNEETRVFYVVNSYRPWSKNLESIDKVMTSIMLVSRIKNIHILANPNFGPETTAEEALLGIRKTQQMLDSCIKVEAACVGEDIYDQVVCQTDLPLIKIRLLLTYEWNTKLA